MLLLNIWTLSVLDILNLHGQSTRRGGTLNNMINLLRKKQ